MYSEFDRMNITDTQSVNTYSTTAADTMQTQQEVLKEKIVEKLVAAPDDWRESAKIEQVLRDDYH
jgi:hypothetical protein